MSKRATFNKVLNYIKHYRLQVIMSLIFAALSVGMTLYLPILIGQTVDLIITKDQVDFNGIAEILIKIGIDRKSVV